MRHVTQADFETRMINFITNELPRLSDRRRGEPAGALAPDTPLFQHGFVDSLGFVHLLAFVEELLDIGIPEEKIVMRHFRTIQAMWRAFAAPSRAAAEGRRAG